MCRCLCLYETADCEPRDLDSFCLLVCLFVFFLFISLFLYFLLNLEKSSREMFPPNNGEPGSPDDHNASDWSASK